MPDELEILTQPQSIVSPPDYDIEVAPKYEAQPEVMAERVEETVVVEPDDFDPVTADPMGWFMHMAHRGEIVDEERARQGACTDLLDPAGARIGTYKDGVMGVLDTDQEALFCLTREQQQVDAPTAQRIRLFMEASQACAGTGSPEDTVHCLSRELTARSVAGA